MIKKLISFFQKDAVLTVSFFLAVLSFFFCPPGPQYLGYLDFHTLILLFCLMLIVAGLRECGVFDWLGTSLLRHVNSERMVALLLISLCFFCSMLITNDVALITFVPFGILLLRMCHMEQKKILLVTFMTMAANLGSMFTPIGNPQNLYLYSLSGLSLLQFLLMMLPYTLGAAVLFLICIFLFFSGKKISVSLEKKAITHPRQIVVFAALFFCCILTVAKLLPHSILLLITIAGICLVNRSLYRRADYSLLFTFVFFFLFIGNMKQMAALRIYLEQMITGHERLLSVLTSQIISNVPAAVLLSGFTDNWRELLLGVDIGGLGTPVASLASLITLKLYLRSPGARPARYLAVFTAWNAALLAVLPLMQAAWEVLRSLL
jgi:Na+/H+ antiporter NhaD/arsenite permease-like protein